MSTKFLSIFALLATSYAVSFAQTTSLDVQSFTTPVLDHLGVPLTAGTTANGDGALIEVGYYSGAIAGNESSLFTGSFVALTGPSSSNTLFANNSTVGDLDSFASGAFGLFALHFDFNVAQVGANLVPVGSSPLVLRIYDSSSIATSTYFNSVSSTATNWTWTAPSLAGSSMAISLDDSLVWQDSTHAFQTSLVTAVPEPATYAAILGFVTLGLVSYRRFRRR